MSFRQRLSLAVRERALPRWGIPFSRHGVAPGVVQFLPKGVPINYIDVGASAGTVAEGIEKHFGIKRGILVEPQPARCVELKQKFNDPKFSVHQCAIADHEGTMEMELLQFDYSSSILPVKRDMANVAGVVDLGVRETIQCRLATLDTIVQEAGWTDDIDLLKIDVQGAELMALKGAGATLSKSRFVQTEVSFTAMYEGSCLFPDVFNHLRGIGFKMVSLHEGFRGSDGELLQGEALFTR